MSIPLVQEATKDAINTSIIAIKRNIERINMLLGLVDSGSPDLSGLATKQELEDAITQVETDLAPVDEVTSGNMQSVTSNAVAVACCRYIDYAHQISISSSSWIATQDCYINMIQLFTAESSPNPLYIDGNSVSSTDSQSGLRIISFCGFIKKGQSIYYKYLNYSNFCKIYPLL